MTRAVVISNPNASRSAAASLQQALEVLRRGGLSVEVAVTQESGHGADAARAALADGAGMVVAHGGDGTILEITAVLSGTGVPLGILPAGTGNRLAENLGIGWSVQAATATILAGRTRALDLGRMETPQQVRYFAVAAGCGFDAEVMDRTSPASKRTYGQLAYIVTGIRLAMTLPGATVRIETDDGVHEGPATTVLLANCSEILPKGRPCAPHVRPDDGVLDVIVLHARSFVDAWRLAGRLASGRVRAGPGITMLRARRVSITAVPDLAAQADGEPCGRTPLTAEVLPGALTVLAPPAR
jgi:diacylglycerol kinase (ATP)